MSQVVCSLVMEILNEGVGLSDFGLSLEFMKYVVFFFDIFRKRFS